MNDPDKALAYMLADSCHDVWMANFRGNSYSRRHERLSPEGGEFWRFSWDEMATKDLPAMIDYALSKTGKMSLSYVGLGMGTTNLLALLSEKPEYNKKVNAAALMGPMAYMTDVALPLKPLAKYFTYLDLKATFMGKEEVFKDRKIVDKLVARGCDEDSKISPLCYFAVSLLSGYNNKMVNKEWLPIILAHNPAGTSIHVLNHYAQLYKSGRFCKYNYHIMNWSKYGRFRTPSYDLKNVTVPVGLFFGKDDYLSGTDDVISLSIELPNVKTFYPIPDVKWNHYDFIWSKLSSTLVYPQVMEFLKTNSRSFIPWLL